MKEKIFKYIPIFSVISMFSILLLLSADSFLYPGIVKRYLLFDSYYFAILSSVITYLYYVYFPKANFQKYCGKIISILTIISIPAVILMSSLENFNYPNYVFSRYHIDPSSLQVLGVFLVLQFALNIVYRENKIYLLKKFKNWLIILFSIAFSLFLLGGNLKARWSIIDDHEIVNVLGSDKKMSLWEIPNKIFQTEVSRWGNLVRYRPSYYTMRVLESFLWGGNPQLWYAVRMGFLAIFLFVLIKIIAKEISLLFGFAFAVYIMTFSYWADILTRLGIAEIYCVLGISIYAYCFYKIIKDNFIKDTSFITWIGLFVGGFIAAGSKENFVIFALPSLFLIVRYLLKKQINYKLIFPFLHVLYSLFIALGIVIAIKKTGQDIYMNEITVVNRWNLLTNGFTKTVAEFKIVGILEVAIILFFWQFRNISIKKFVFKSINTIYFLIFLFITYLFQIVFYSGFWPTGTRYDFPGILAQQIFWLAWFALLLRFTKTINNKLVTKVCLGIVISVSTIMIFSSFKIGFSSVLAAVDRNVVSTNMFTSRLDRLLQVTLKYPDFPIIFRSRNLWDYEAVYSLERYIKYLNIKNQLSLDYEDKQIISRSGLEKYLSEDLNELSKTGLFGDRISFRPFSKINTKLGCIDLNLSYSVTNSGCIDIDKY